MEAYEDKYEKKRADDDDDEEEEEMDERSLFVESLPGFWAGDSQHSSNVDVGFAPTVMKLITTSIQLQGVGMEPMHAGDQQDWGERGGGCNSSRSQFIGPTVLLWLLVARGTNGGRENVLSAISVPSYYTTSRC